MAEGYEPKPNSGFEIIEYTNQQTNNGGYIFLDTTNKKILVFAVIDEFFVLPLRNPGGNWFVRVFDGNLNVQINKNIPSMTALWFSI